MGGPNPRPCLCAHLTITFSEIKRDIGRKSLEGFPYVDLRAILHGPLQMPNVQNRVKNIAQNGRRKQI